MYGDTCHAETPKLDAVLLARKQEKLFAILGSMRRVMVAYSGGTDSAYLAWACTSGSGKRCNRCYPPIPPRFPNRISAMPRRSRKSVESGTSTLKPHEFDNPDYVKNDPNRCFHCKDELFTELDELGRLVVSEHHCLWRECRRSWGLSAGQKAAKLHQVKAPMVDAD